MICGLTHEQKEPREARVEPRRLQPKRIPGVAVLAGHLRRVGDVGAVCVERGDEGAAEGEPEGAWEGESGRRSAVLLLFEIERWDHVRWRLTESAEDDKGERVADDPLSD